MHGKVKRTVERKGLEFGCLAAQGKITGIQFAGQDGKEGLRVDPGVGSSTKGFGRAEPQSASKHVDGRVQHPTERDSKIAKHIFDE